MKFTKSPSYKDIRPFNNRIVISNKENQINNHNKPLFSSYSLQLRNESIEWLYKAQVNLRFSRSTLFLAIGLIDQLLLQNNSFLEGNQQISTATVLLICAKFNQVYPPTVKKINCNCSDEYCLAQFEQIEADILEKINFTISPDQIYGQLAEFQSNFEEKTPETVRQTIKTALMNPNEIFKYGKFYFMQGLRSYLNGGVFERCSNRMNHPMEVFEIRKQLTRLRSASLKRLVNHQQV